MLNNEWINSTKCKQKPTDNARYFLYENHNPISR